MPYGIINIGLTTWVAYFFAFINYVWGYLLDLGSGSFHWDSLGTSQLVLVGNVPQMTLKGNDIIVALMTILHNGLVFMAELSTVLRS